MILLIGTITSVLKLCIFIVWCIFLLVNNLNNFIVFNILWPVGIPPFVGNIFLVTNSWRLRGGYNIFLSESHATILQYSANVIVV